MTETLGGPGFGAVIRSGPGPILFFSDDPALVVRASRKAARMLPEHHVVPMPPDCREMAEEEWRTDHKAACRRMHRDRYKTRLPYDIARANGHRKLHGIWFESIGPFGAAEMVLLYAPMEVFKIPELNETLTTARAKWFRVVFLCDTHETALMARRVAPEALPEHYQILLSHYGWEATHTVLTRLPRDEGSRDRGWIH